MSGNTINLPDGRELDLTVTGPSYPWAANRDCVRHYLWVGIPGLDGFAMPAGCAITIPTESLLWPFLNNWQNDRRVDSWLSKVDQDINYKAMEYGLLTSQILLPIHPRIREYAEAYLCFMICRDNIGVNNVQSAQDEKYRVKYNEYRVEKERCRKLLTRDIFWLPDAAISGVNRQGGACDLVRS